MNFNSKKLLLLTIIVFLLMGIVTAASNDTVDNPDKISSNNIEKINQENTEINDNNINKNNIDYKNNTKVKTITKTKNTLKQQSEDTTRLVVENISYDTNNASLLTIKAKEYNKKTNKSTYDYDLRLKVKYSNVESTFSASCTENNTIYFYFPIEKTGKHQLSINSSNLDSAWQKNITINKLSTVKTPLNIKISSYNKTLTAGDLFNIKGSVTDNKNKPVSGINVQLQLNNTNDNNEYLYTDENGHFEGRLILYPGVSNITVTPYLYDNETTNKYLTFKPQTVTVTVKKVNLTNLKIQLNTIVKKAEYDDMVDISGYVVDKNNNPVNGVIVNITSNIKDFKLRHDKVMSGDVDILGFSTKGKFNTYTRKLGVGNHTITFRIDDENNKNNIQTVKIEVIPKKANISLSNVSKTIKNADIINITGYLEENGFKKILNKTDIIFEINNKKYPAEESFSDDGLKVSFYVNKTGNYTIKATSNLTGYEKVSTSKTFQVTSLSNKKYNETLAITPYNGLYNNTTKKVAYKIDTSVDYDNIPLLIKINNFTDSIYSGHAYVIYEYQPPANGKYSIQVSYDSRNFYPKTVTSNFTINWFDNVTIKANTINNTTVNQNAIISGYLYNQKNKTLPNMVINFKDGNKTAQFKTDKNGYYSYKYNVTTYGKHTITLSVPGTNSTNPANKTQSFYGINPTKISITANDTEFVNKKFNVTIRAYDPLTNKSFNKEATLTLIINNTTKSIKTNTNGIYVLNQTYNKESNITITVKFKGSAQFHPTNATKKIEIISEETKYLRDLEKKLKDYENIIKQLNTTVKNQNTTIKNLNSTVKSQNTTIKNLNSTVQSQAKTINSLNNTVKSQNNTIKNLNNTIKNLNNTVQSQAKTITSLNNTVKNQNNTIKNLNNTVKNQNNTIKNLNSTVQSQNKTINSLNNNVKSQNNTIKNLNSTVQSQAKTITSLNNTVKSQNTTIKNLNSTVQSQAKTITSLNNTVKNQNNTIKNQNKTINDLKNNITNLTTKLSTKITINKITGVVGNNTTITASVVDSKNKKVHDGFLLFKVNGLTLKDTAGNDIYVPLVNGTARFKYEIPRSWYNNATSMQAIYTGTSQYNESTTNKSGIFNISNGTVKISLANMTTHENGDNTQFVVTVTDLNDNPMKDGRVIIKVNGLTLKDEKGNNIEAKVKNGIAIMDYKIAIGARDHNITAVYFYTGYNRAETSNTLKVIKAEPFIRYSPITTKTNSTYIKATIVDKYKNLLYSNVTFVMSINGKKYNTTAVKGIVNFKIPTDFKAGTYRVSFAVYETGAFKSDSITSVLIKE